MMNVKSRAVIFFVVCISIISGVSSAQAPVLTGDAIVEQTPSMPTPKLEAPSASVVVSPIPDKTAPVIPPAPTPPASKPEDPSTPVAVSLTPDKTASVIPPASTPAAIGEKELGSPEDQLTEKEKEDNKDVLDTVDAQSTSGNWVFKNYWWKKIQDVYSQIRDAFNIVMTARMKFFEDRNAVDKELDTFYQSTGLEQGPLQDILEYSLQIIEKEKEDQGYLDKKERAFLEKIQEKQRQLEQLREDVKAIEELDQKIDDALEVVLQQVDVCNKYMQEAWDISRDVARELSDKEARKQYYDTKGLLDDVNKVHQYFIGPFSQYFAQMIKSVHDNTRSIAAQLETLKNAGLDLKKESHIFEAEDEELERKKAEAQEERKKELERRKKKKEKSAEQDTGILEGTLAKIKEFFASTVDYVTAVVAKSKNFFDGIIGTVKGWVFSAEDKGEAVERAVKKEVQEIEKDPQGQAYKAGKVIHEAVGDAAEYVEDKAEGFAEYAQGKLHEGDEYLETKARALKEELDDAEDDIEKDTEDVEDDAHDLLDDI
jgi:hypothetical protein